MSARRVTVRAPAKVNLALAVLGKRPDGYHELDSVMMALELGDVLTAEARGAECTLGVIGPAREGVPEDGTNLVVRAALAVRALAERQGLAPGGVHLTLEKHVPAQAGLAGGSSDAAAAALACAELWGIDPDDPGILTALVALGSDCAFFLAARASGLARCTGRGEIVEPLAALRLPWSLAIVTPAFGCSTALVYGALLPSGRRERRPLEPRALEAAPMEEARALLANELEPAAARAYPELARFREHLEELAPGAFRLAGSGSSCFGFFADEASARAVLERVGGANRGRRYALRGRWVVPARSRGLGLVHSSAH